MKIMYVEDDESQRRLMQLRFPEWVVEVSPDPEGARVLMDANGHEAIVLDLHLSCGMTWQEAVRYLQELFVAPIIGYSGFVDDAIRESLLAMGVYDVLTKGEADDKWNLKRAVEGAAAKFKLKRYELERTRGLTDLRDQIRTLNRELREAGGIHGDRSG